MTDQDPNVVDLNTPEGRAQATAQMAMHQHPQQFPDKFKNADGSLNQDLLVQAYTELERKQSMSLDGPPPTGSATNPTSPDALLNPSAGVPAAAGEVPDGGAPAVTTSDGTTIDDLLRDPAPAKESPVDWQALQDEVSRTGEVSAETMAKLQTAGVPREAIAAAIQGWKLQAQEQFKRAAELVGGDEALKATISWAKETMSAEQIAALQGALRGELGEQTLIGLKAAYDKANPSSPLIDTSKSPNAGGPPQMANITPYRTKGEMYADMNKPEYQYNPDFQKYVAQRCAAGNGTDPRRFDDPKYNR